MHGRRRRRLLLKWRCFLAGGLCDCRGSLSRISDNRSLRSGGGSQQSSSIHIRKEKSRVGYYSLNERIGRVTSKRDNGSDGIVEWYSCISLRSIETIMIWSVELFFSYGY